MPNADCADISWTLTTVKAPVSRRVIIDSRTP
jgi:hypothetical protein